MQRDSILKMSKGLHSSPMTFSRHNHKYIKNNDPELPKIHKIEDPYFMRGHGLYHNKYERLLGFPLKRKQRPKSKMQLSQGKIGKRN